MERDFDPSGVLRCYNNLLNDYDFEELSLKLKKVNIFRVLGISHYEIRHSNFLAWLLDPNETHKLGNIFLKTILRELFLSEKFENISPLDVEDAISDDVEIRREWRNIDVLIILKDHVITIENKVNSREHSNQLSRYKKIIESTFPKIKNKVFVYLTPFGDEAGSEEDRDNYEALSYEFILEVLERYLDLYQDEMTESVRIYIKNYIEILMQDVVKNDKMSDLAQKIYEQHKLLFDFVQEHKRDEVMHVNQFLKKYIEEKNWELASTNKAYIRFIPYNIQPFLYVNTDKSKGWKNNESFLFEFLVRLNHKEQLVNISFATVIGPCDDHYKSTILHNILENIKGFHASKGKKWLVNYRKSINVSLDEVLSYDTNAPSKDLKKFFDQIEDAVQKVEDAILNNKEILTKAINDAEFSLAE